MEIVIKIPEVSYKALCNGCMLPPDVENVVQGIKNGTSLPEHHGRLIDADALYDSAKLCHTEEDGTACVEWREINDAPTIIEGSDSE